MSGTLTDLLFELKLNFSENFCKYILYRTLKGLDFLHERCVFHSGIKSDNILVNHLEGDVKLADFGDGVILTKEN